MWGILLTLDIPTVSPSSMISSILYGYAPPRMEVYSSTSTYIIVATLNGTHTRGLEDFRHKEPVEPSVEPCL